MFSRNYYVNILHIQYDKILSRLQKIHVLGYTCTWNSINVFSIDLLEVFLVEQTRTCGWRVVDQPWPGGGFFLCRKGRLWSPINGCLGS